MELVVKDIIEKSMEDTTNPTASELSVAIESIYENKTMDKNIVKSVIHHLLKNILNDEIDLKNELLMYTGYCDMCDSEVKLFKIEIEDYDNTLDYANAMCKASKHKQPLTYKDILCKICARPLYCIDPYEIY
ncbi:hypothetical protein WIV_gp122 [Wiseana iridescent virus]|uniref:Uncharacterized protein n=1 Tax=Wiseana iridescent virus TaxID=68347 RepID=G0T5E8_IRV9|nr:hypothetical protein WIV_gp122 [Wiseana iridescent virus]ADO00466.1 hypothetical protein [Wiseana iridescent virus]